MWQIPDQGSGAYDLQSELFSASLKALVAGLAGTGVVSGCAVSQHSPSAAMSVDVAAGVVAVAGTEVAVSAGTVTIGAADPSLPRIDLVVSDGSGTLSVLAGTAAASPKEPALDTTLYVLMAQVLVPAATGAITTSLITDRTVPLRPVIPVVSWSALTVFQAYQLVQLPTGGLGYVTAGYTSRASFDATERAAWHFLPGGHVEFFTSSGSWITPTGIAIADFEVIGGGGGGAGGGSAANSGGVATQVGGSGGGGGAVNRTELAVAGTYTITVGAGGTHGNGGAANGNAGTVGNTGGTSSVVNGGQSVSAAGGGGGGAGGANSVATTTAGLYGANGRVNANLIPGCGGTATSANGNAAPPLTKTTGGGGGAPASSTNGGAGGNIATPGNGATSTTSTVAGVSGGAGSTPANAGLGGSGGGGGAPTGAGGDGGDGFRGHVRVYF